MVPVGSKIQSEKNQYERSIHFQLGKISEVCRPDACRNKDPDADIEHIVYEAICQVREESDEATG